MKNKNIYISMLILIVFFLLSIYVLKIFMPNEFLMIVDNENLIKIGQFVESNNVLYYCITGVTAFITYWLYCCACTHRLRLKWWECLVIIVVVVLIRLCGLYVSETLRTTLSWLSFIILPALFNGNLRTTALVFTTHTISQYLSLSIRSLPIYLTNINFIVILFVTIECYLWLFLFYIVFNYKGGK